MNEKIKERKKELDEIFLYACMTYLLIHKDSIIENRVSILWFQTHNRKLLVYKKKKIEFAILNMNLVGLNG